MTGVKGATMFRSKSFACLGRRFGDYSKFLPGRAAQCRVRVNFIEYWEVGECKGQHLSWVTNLRVSPRNVYHLMRGGRGR